MKIAARACLAGVVLAGLLAAPGVCAQDFAPKLSVDLGGGVKMDFVLINAGSFMMGSKKGANGKPVHKVAITKPFYMGVYEVTQAQWKALLGDNPLWFKGDGLPVENISWDDCQKFLAKLQEKAGPGMICRLPTEAEWEYACRAGSQTAYCFGDDKGGLGDYAWYRANSENKTHPVGQKKPNAWGLYDMHGNVWEWCADGYGFLYYAKSPAEDPKGAAETDYRVLRGGSWESNPGSLRSDFRRRSDPLRWDSFVGCRVVMSAQE